MEVLIIDNISNRLPERVTVKAKNGMLDIFGIKIPVADVNTMSFELKLKMQSYAASTITNGVSLLSTAQVAYKIGTLKRLELESLDLELSWDKVITEEIKPVLV